MKYLIVFTLLFWGCNKVDHKIKEPKEPQISKYITCKINGVEFSDFYIPYPLRIIADSNYFGLLGFSTYNGWTQQLTISSIPVKVGFNPVLSLGTRLNHPLDSCRGFLADVDDDQINNLYDVVLGSNSFVEVIEYNETTKVASGRFQLKLGRLYQAQQPYPSPGFTDSLLITEGKFVVAIGD